MSDLRKLINLFESAEPAQVEESEILAEGGDATSKRFFSELGALAAWAGYEGSVPNFDPEHPEQWLDPKKLANPEKIFGEIRRFLGPATKGYNALDKKPHFDIAEYYARSKQGRDIILANISEKGLAPPTKFDWVGGENARSVGATPSDVDFVDGDVAGVSIKDDGGVGLANLGAGELEFEGEGDLFARLAPSELLALKKAIMTDLLKEVKQNGEYVVPSSPNNKIVYDPKDKQYPFIVYAKNKKPAKATVADLLGEDYLSKSYAYQRFLGDYFLANAGKYTKYTNALLVATSDKIRDAIENKVIPNADKLAKLGGFGNKAYYYQLAKPFKVAFVPDKSTANDIEIVKITPPKVMSGGLKYLIALRRRGMEDYATVEAHIRYAQGVFSSSPSFRIQSLKGAQNLYWEILTSK